MSPPRLLVSACLLGEAVRHDGRDKKLVHGALARWQDEGRVVTICPELAGGLGVPRLPAEIEPGQDGTSVLEDKAAVFDRNGRDVTDAFVGGAMAAVDLAFETGCRYALLKDSSPSCGTQMIYSGRFDGSKTPGTGVTAALLKREGIQVFSDEGFEELVALMDAHSVG